MTFRAAAFIRALRDPTWPRPTLVYRAADRSDEDVLSALLHMMDAELREKYPDIFERVDRRKARRRRAGRDPE